MALKKEVKTEIIEKYAREAGDTGSPEVQIALLSKAYYPTDRSPAHQQARRVFSPWSVEAGGSAPSSFGIFAPEEL